MTNKQKDENVLFLGQNQLHCTQGFMSKAKRCNKHVAAQYTHFILSITVTPISKVTSDRSWLRDIKFRTPEKYFRYEFWQKRPVPSLFPKVWVGISPANLHGAINVEVFGVPAAGIFVASLMGDSSSGMLAAFWSEHLQPPFVKATNCAPCHQTTWQGILA